MNKPIEWWVLLLGGIVCYGVGYVVGGVIGGAFSLLAIILFALGVVRLVTVSVKKD